MIQAISKVTLYVNNQEEAKAFWIHKMGFEVSFEQAMGSGMTWLEVAPKGAQTHFVLYDKEIMKQQNPQASVEHPSIILTTKDIKSAYEQLQAQGVKVGKLMEMPYGKMFPFYDPDDHAYLLRED